MTGDRERKAVTGRARAASAGGGSFGIQVPRNYTEASMTACVRPVIGHSPIRVSLHSSLARPVPFPRLSVSGDTTALCHNRGSSTAIYLVEH